jgi:TPR repeat protein
MFIKEKQFVRTIITSIAGALLLTSCAHIDETAPVPEDADKLLIVDCLLPPQVRKLGSNFSYAAARRPVKTSAADCEIRGGEYVAYDRADYRTALKVWLPQAEAGDPEAQNYVGQIYEKGLGLEEDYQTAAYWYKKSAAQGFSEAQINLGYLYEKGLGVTQDSAKALNLYRKASGIQDDSLEFASTVEVARVSQDKLAKLQRQLEAERQKNQRLQKDVASVRDEMGDLSQKLELARAQKRSKELELRLAKSEQSDGSAPVNEQQLRAEIASYEKKLSTGEKALKNYQAKEDDLKQKLEANTLQLASAELNQGRMSIQLIDPPMAITRGVRGTTVEESAEEKEIFGKINAPGGLNELLINSSPYELDKFSMFWATVPIEGSVTPVDIIATDKLGQKVDYSFTIFSDQTPESDTAVPENVDLELGRYRALIIGNNSYNGIPSLSTAVADAQAADKILRERYGFETTLLLNASRYEILNSLDQLRQTMTADDNLLIYYAGHGEIDRLNDRGYWLPVDADPELRTNWISNVAITDIINAMPAHHIMVVADSCYSGTLAQSNLAAAGLDQNTQPDMDWVVAMEDVNARTVLTSGGVRPVLDIGGGEHSVFAKAFLSVLSNNDRLIEGHTLYRQIMRQMRVSMARINQTQVPEYAPIKHAGHEGGEFFLKPVDAI